jgi:hypothetical protein
MGAGMLVETGQTIKTSVREFFAQGHKSTNKEYDLDGPSVELRSPGWEQKYQQRAEKRYTEGDLSAVHRLSFEGLKSYYELAEKLLKMPVSDRSGNCMEMAALSNYEAINDHNTGRFLCYLCFITAPGDHAFALISEHPIMDRRAMGYASVLKFTQSPFARSWLVIDPWLNTVCTADSYLATGGQKLEEWTAKGKRIAWVHGSQGAGFYPPGGSNGEYKQKFAIAPLAIAPF